MAFKFPEQFIEHLSTAPGMSEASFYETHLRAAPVSVRLNPHKKSSQFNDLPVIPWCPFGRYLPSRPDFTLDPLFHAGSYYVQEASSMSIWSALDELVPDKTGVNILDLCAAPGGKSTLIASWLNGNGLLVANETIRSRAGILADNLNRWGTSNVVVSNNDPRQFGKLPGYFDVIVVDAPCSGSGMFRKDPGAMKHWSEEAVAHCAARQERILEDVWPALKKDGILIYSTCSYSEAEDEKISEYIMNELGGEVLKIESLEKQEGIVSTGAGYRFYPNRIEGEGFYLSALRKTMPAEKLHWRSSGKHEKFPEVLKSWLQKPEKLIFQESHLGACLIPVEISESIPPLLKHLHVLKAGTLAGEMKGKHFLPDHELAMSNLLHADIPRLELTREEALQFLKKQALPGKPTLNGWHLMTWQHLGLGWGNCLPNRINNYLPKGLRILKELE
jgi:16S rRNA C967 or C1407 C5-methylase (RsmB/RsmF family)/NOL1/NOP2/fmu family ribosome biogenesis protein